LGGGAGHGEGEQEPGTNGTETHKNPCPQYTETWAFNPPCSRYPCRVQSKPAGSSYFAGEDPPAPRTLRARFFSLRGNLDLFFLASFGIFCETRPVGTAAASAAGSGDPFSSVFGAGSFGFCSLAFESLAFGSLGVWSLGFGSFGFCSFGFCSFSFAIYPVCVVWLSSCLGREVKPNRDRQEAMVSPAARQNVEGTGGEPRHFRK
jgi:hypothetical protein